MIAKSTGISHRDGGTTTESPNDSSAIIYLPFAVPDSNSTSAVLVISELPGDTIYNLLYPQYYRQYGFDTTAQGWNARNMFSMFAEFDYTLFGTTTFKITDGRIFGGTANDSLILTRKPRVGNFRSQSLSTWVQVCITYTIMPPTQNKSITIQSLMGEGSYEICTDYWFFDNGGGGGGGTSGGGSTSGGGGSGGSSSWPDQPSCPAQPKGYVTNLQISDPCSPGWVPIQDPIIRVIEPIDSMLARYCRAIKDTAIYIYDILSKPNNVEYAITGILYNGQVSVIERRTNNDSLQVFPKVMIGNLNLLFTWHSHVSRSSDLSQRGSFSPSDIDMLRNVRCLKQNFTSFADCRNKRYSLVITDVVKATAFFNSNTTDDIWDNHNTNISGTQQTKDEASIVNTIGSSSVNGISFYVSNDSPNFQTWILINL